MRAVQLLPLFLLASVISCSTVQTQQDQLRMLERLLTQKPAAATFWGRLTSALLRTTARA